MHCISYRRIKLKPHQKGAARGGTGTTAHSDPPNDVLHRACFLLKANDFGTYSLFKNNCEDFAIYCKTSLVKKRTTISRSGQIKTLIASIFGGGNIAGAGFNGMAVGSILGGGGIPTPINLRSNCLYQSDISFNRDFVKVPVEKLAEYIRP
ncbi:NC domain-containing family protein [Rhynchospora pubera]|uniref:NC domain-containing family protein n=1 Tax=Rhynchospora pubera TaxID=906938 RepID=A0AAV8C9N9_9POAL|nr:NC domain-containing family protein [Rhynchospora pubera]